MRRFTPVVAQLLSSQAAQRLTLPFITPVVTTYIYQSSRDFFYTLAHSALGTTLDPPTLPLRRRRVPFGPQNLELAEPSIQYPILEQLHRDTASIRHRLETSIIRPSIFQDICNHGCRQRMGKHFPALRFPFFASIPKCLGTLVDPLVSGPSSWTLFYVGDPRWLRHRRLPRNGPIQGPD